MRIIAALALLFAFSPAVFGQDPNRNRMNDPYPEARPQELGRAPAGGPTANGNRMNVEYAAAPPAELAGGPNPFANRLNAPAPQPETNAQAEKPPKKR